MSAGGIAVAARNHLDTNMSSLGSTIEEKTRRILGWTDDFTPSLTSVPARSPLSTTVRRVDRNRSKRASAALNSAPYPYSLLNSAENRGRRAQPSPDVKPTQLTPPPSPVYNANGVTIMSLPRTPGSTPTPPSTMPPPPSYQQAVATSTLLSPVANDVGQATTAREAFERLKRLVPTLGSEKSRYRALVQTVAQVIELEAKLALLREETRGLSQALATCSQTNSNGSLLLQPQQSLKTTMLTTKPHLIGFNTVVPEDLLNVDLSAFKSLVQSPTPSSISSPSCYSTASNPSPDGSYEGESVGFDFDADVWGCYHGSQAPLPSIDSLTVDTSFGQSVW